MRKIEPFEGWVVAVTRAEERVSAGGIIQPATTMAEDEGVVTAIGPGVTRCKVGDTVIFNRCHLKKGAHGDYQYLVEEKNLLGRYRDE